MYTSPELRYSSHYTVFGDILNVYVVALHSYTFFIKNKLNKNSEAQIPLK